MVVKRCGDLFILFLVLVLALFGGSCRKDKPPDKTPPTVPNGIAITAVSISEIKITWKPAVDDSGKVKGYKVYKNGKHLKSIETTSVSDTGLIRQVKFCYRISAYDKDGNESAQSTEVCAIL